MVLLIPEISTFLMAFIFYILSMLRLKKEDIKDVAQLLTFFNVLVVLSAITFSGTMFHGTYRIDLFSQVMKFFLAFGLFMAVYLTDAREEAIRDRYGEFLFFLATANLGMMMITSAVEIATLLVCLELSSFSLFVLVGFNSESPRTVEAAVKYVFIGGVATAVTFFFVGYIVGFCHTSYLADIGKYLSSTTNPIVVASLILFFSAFFFKLSIVPFHFWTPDVYEASPIPVTNYLATVSKLAGVAVLVRLFHSVGVVQVHNLKPLILWVALATMTYGNLVALKQKDVKRLIAYSSIAQAGYMLVAIALGTEKALSSAVFYAFGYLIMNYTVFLVADHVEKDRGSTAFESFAGLCMREPLLSLALLTALLSLGGVPPFVGFTGKWFIFGSAMKEGYGYVVLIAFLNSVVSVYYYFLVIRQAYLIEPEDAMVVNVRVPYATKVIGYLSILFVMLFGIYPTPLYRLAEVAVRALF